MGRFQPVVADTGTKLGILLCWDKRLGSDKKGLLVVAVLHQLFLHHHDSC